MEERLVSIIIPAYNCEKYIDVCIENLLHQTYKPIQIIVILDKSEDKSEDILKKYGEQILLIIREKTNPASARNCGIQKAEGEFIAFCDSDDISHPDRIMYEVETLVNNVNVALTYSDFCICNESGEKIRDVIVPEWNRTKWIYNNYICFSTVMVRKSKLNFQIHDNNTIFNTDYPAFEDLDFLIRFSSNQEFKKTWSTLTTYRHSKSSLGKKFERMLKIRLEILLKNRLWIPFIYYAFIDTPLKFLKIIIRRGD